MSMSWYEHAIRRCEHRRWTTDDNRMVRPFAWGLEHLDGKNWGYHSEGPWTARAVVGAALGRLFGQGEASGESVAFYERDNLAQSARFAGHAEGQQREEHPSREEHAASIGERECHCQR